MVLVFLFFFFFNAPATTEIYTLSLHDALPICPLLASCDLGLQGVEPVLPEGAVALEPVVELGEPLWTQAVDARSEEHTSELQSHVNLVCRLLLEKKKIKQPQTLHLIKECISTH